MLKYTNATPRTYRIAACMMETGIDAAAINREMFDTRPAPGWRWSAGFWTP